MKALLLAAVLGAAPVNIKAGEPAPYDGALVDAPTAESIRQKRAQCEVENEKLRKILEEKPPAPPPPYGVFFYGVGVGVGLSAVLATVLLIKAGK